MYSEFCVVQVVVEVEEVDFDGEAGVCGWSFADVADSELEFLWGVVFGGRDDVGCG